MRNNLIYDLPTRLFHWIFAGLFLTAFIIAQTVEDDSAIFTLHMLAGLMLTFVVLLRIVWGFVGSKHAKFIDFSLHPKSVFAYFRGILSGSKERWAGHNPASSWAALLMMLFALGLGLTGFLMTSGPNKENFEDIHELLSNGFIIVAVLHVAGVLLHTLRHKEMIGLSMIDGKKNDVPTSEEITSSRPAAGVLFLGLVIALSVYIYKNYDRQNQTLQLFNTQLKLGENEASGHGGDSDDDD